MLSFFGSTHQTKADPVTASVVVSVIALGFVVATPFLDKNNQKETENEGIVEIGRETNNDLPSRSELENIKDDLGKRWVRGSSWATGN